MGNMLVLSDYKNSRKKMNKKKKILKIWMKKPKMVTVKINKSKVQINISSKFQFFHKFYPNYPLEKKVVDKKRLQLEKKVT